MSRLSEKQKIIFILTAGVLIRLLYILFMPVVNFAQYDIGSVFWEQDSLTGHLGYIMYLVKYHEIPQFDPTTVYQFNHPPVHHIISALLVSVVRLFTDNVKTWIEAVQFITLIYSVVTLWAVDKIAEEMNLPFKGRAFVDLIWAFQPTLIMTAGSVNNDGAGLMFQVLAVWFSLRFYRTRKTKDILGVALTIGIGMISKLSAGLVAVPIGALFIYIFVNEWVSLKKFPINRFKQYILFGIICFPIGLCWVIRCAVRFGMSPTYIAYLPDTSPQYVGMYSTFERMFFPNPLTLLSNLLHGSLGMGWNVWVQMLRTSALGECDLSIFPMWTKLLCLLMIGINFVVAVWAFVAFIRVFFIKKTDCGHRIFWILGWVIMMYSYLSFAYTYPHECSMNFRYVQFGILPPLIALGLIKGSDKFFAKLVKYTVTISYVLVSVMIIFSWCRYGA